MAPDPLADSRYSLDCAKGHVEELKREIRAFNDGHPYTRVVDRDANSVLDRHKFVLAKPLPLAIPRLIAEIAFWLRCALDQAGFAAAAAADPTKGAHAKFPFGDTLTEVQSRAGVSSKDLPKEIFDWMVACQPYEGGNDLLWGLNKLCNTQKHESIVCPRLTLSGLHIAAANKDGGHFVEKPEWDSTKDELVFFVGPHGRQPWYNLHPQIDVVIGPVKGVGGQPALAVCDKLRSEVERILGSLEAKARSIGLFA